MEITTLPPSNFSRLESYGVQKPEVHVCIAEGCGSAADFPFADPYATDAESKSMFKAIADHIKGKLPLRKLKGAISRILSKEPLAAIKPPKKRRRDESQDKNDDAPAADAAGASDISESSKTTKLKSSSKSKFKDDSSDSSPDDSSDSNDGDDGDVDNLKESSSKASSSKSKSLDALFNSVANRKIRRSRKKLPKACNAHKKIEGAPPYFVILERFRDLRGCIGSVHSAAARKGRLSDLIQLKDVLERFYKIMEDHAAKRGRGLARMVCNEISGFGGWKIFN